MQYRNRNVSKRRCECSRINPPCGCGHVCRQGDQIRVCICTITHWRLCVRRRTERRVAFSYFVRMLHQFLTQNRDLLIERCRAKVAKRFEPTEAASTVDHGVPLFLQQLAETLQAELTTSARGSVESEPAPAPTAIGRAAALHGAELLRRGFTADQVVHDYGDVCQTVTALAIEQGSPISVDEFRTLNRCLDNAIADAVASFGEARQVSLDRQVQTSQ